MELDIEDLEEIKRRIFEKVDERMRELQSGSSAGPEIRPEPQPVVIVIPDDQSLLFEPQNQRALELLARCCGLALEGMTLPERIRVHPCRSRQIIGALKAAGVTVSGHEFQPASNRKMNPA